MTAESTRRLFRMLSNENRRAVLAELSDKDTGMRLIDLSVALKTSRETLNHHLIKLMQNSMVSKREKYYCITEFGLACLSVYKEFEKMVAKWYKRG